MIPPSRKAGAAIDQSAFDLRLAARGSRFRANRLLSIGHPLHSLFCDFR